MATLTNNAPRDYALGDLDDYPIIADEIIFAGAAVGDNGSGLARPLVAGDAFKGFATQKANNTAGAASEVNVRTRTKGCVVLTIAGVVAADFGKSVYASDDDTFTLTAGSNTCIGSVSQFESSNTAVVDFNATQSIEPALTDSSGGTASEIIVAIGGTYSQTEVANVIASLTAKVNFLLQRLGA